MSNWIAVSWDHEQILVVTVRGMKGRPVYDRAVRIALNSSDLQTVKDRLHQFVRDEKLAKSDTTVVLGRNAVELRSMSFPPVPDDEIPEMAKFVAGKEFSEFDTTLPFDVFVLPEIVKGKKTILASTLGKAKLAEIHDVCSSAGLSLKRIVLGPFEEIPLFAKNEHFSENLTQLLLNFSGKTGTFSVLYQGKPVFVRSFLMDGSIEEKLNNEDTDWKWLLPEIKKTILSGLQEIPVEKIDRILISGDEKSLKNLAGFLEERFQTPVKVIFPLEKVTRGGEIQKHLPPHAEIFAPLVGALSPPFAGKPNQLDFLNPKRKKEPVQHRQLITIAVVLAFLFFLGFLGYGYQRRTALTKEFEQNGATLRIETQKANDAERKRRKYAVITDWKKNQIFWLQELDWLSSKVPTSADTLLTELQVRADKGLGEMKFKGNAKSGQVIPIMEESLQDKTHRLQSHKTTVVPNTQGYPYTFDMAVKVTPTVLVPTQNEAPTQNEVVQ